MNNAKTRLAVFYITTQNPTDIASPEVDIKTSVSISSPMTLRVGNNYQNYDLGSYDFSSQYPGTIDVTTFYEATPKVENQYFAYPSPFGQYTVERLRGKMFAANVKVSDHRAWVYLSYTGEEIKDCVLSVACEDYGEKAECESLPTCKWLGALCVDKSFFAPTFAPTLKPTKKPTTLKPTARPTLRPTKKPIKSPTTRPTLKPANPSTPTIPTKTKKPTKAPITPKPTAPVACTKIKTAALCSLRSDCTWSGRKCIPLA